jgi:hypothetical protein
VRCASALAGAGQAKCRLASSSTDEACDTRALAAAHAAIVGLRIIMPHDCKRRRARETGKFTPRPRPSSRPLHGRRPRGSLPIRWSSKCGPQHRAAPRERQRGPRVANYCGKAFGSQWRVLGQRVTDAESQ